MKTKWNPTQYEKFKDQRAKPFFDLMNLIEQDPITTALDLGCGTGELTRALFDRFQPHAMHAIDSSPEMLEKSMRYQNEKLRFELADISHFTPSHRFDLVFSNAALQWLDHHEELFAQMANWVSDHGQIAIQMPCNFDHPSHRLAAEVANNLYPEKFPTIKTPSVLSLDRYAEILFSQGFRKQIARIEVYGHLMKSGQDVIEWTKGTLLTSYQAKLTEDEFQKFLSEYQSKLLKKIGTGPYFYAFKRILLWGKRGQSNEE